MCFGLVFGWLVVGLVGGVVFVGVGVGFGFVVGCVLVLVWGVWLWLLVGLVTLA